MQLPCEFKNLYISRRKADFDKLKMALLESSVEDFRKVGHQIMGNAATYGFEDLEVIGEKMNLLKTKVDLLFQGADILREFEKWLIKNENVYQVLPVTGSPQFLPPSPIPR